MKREIFEVYAKVVDANGAYNTLSGYPKVFDSHQNNDDIEKAKNKAYGEFHTVLGTMYNRFDRQCQIAMILRASDGLQIEKVCLGTVADLPDPKYTVTVTNGTGSGEYEANQTVTIVADAPEKGKAFASWQGAEGLTFVEGGVNTSFARFIMPSNAVAVTATYEDAPEPKYVVTVTNGTGSGEYEEGEEVTILADQPNDGTVFSSWEGAEGLIFTDGDATTAEATFEMPDHSVALVATYAEQ